MYNTLADTALDFALKVPDILRSSNSDSLIEFTQPTRVEPIVLMDDAAVSLPQMPDVMQSLVSIQAAYYLMAVSLSVNVGKVDVIGLLDRVNPRRSVQDNMVRGATHMGQRMGYGTEALYDASAYHHGLPVPGQAVGAESFGLESVSLQKDLNKLVQETSNLSVGKLLEVTIDSEGVKATFPIQIRLIATTAPRDVVVNNLTIDSKDLSASGRFFDWRLGKLDFIQDMMLCRDLVDEHRKSLIKDTSGMYRDTIKRRRGNRFSALMSGKPSVATASNIFVITPETQKQIENTVGGRLSDFRTREKIFDRTYGMLMAVVDPKWDLVTIYHRSLEIPTELGAGDLRNQRNSKGPDVMDLLNMYQKGKGVNF